VNSNPSFDVPASTQPRPIGVAYLTLAPLRAPDAVEIAAEAGYDFVGLRVKPFGAGDPDLQMGPGSPLLAQTARRLRETGLRVLDIEFVLLTESVRPSDWLPALESGAELGASLLSVAISDPDLSRAEANLAALTADAAAFGIRPSLEPISYQPFSGLQDAAAVARRTGATLLVDPLHLTRTGTDFSLIADLEPDLVPVLQLCDAWAEAPGDGDISQLAHESRFNRLPVGWGSLPLAALARAVPAGVPVSVEVPNEPMRATMSDREFAAMNLSAARALLQAIEEETEITA